MMSIRGEILLIKKLFNRGLTNRVLDCLIPVIGILSFIGLYKKNILDVVGVFCLYKNDLTEYHQ